MGEGKAGPIRWTPARKAWLLAAIDGGELPAAEAAAAPYFVSAEELGHWRAIVARGGEAALRAKCIKRFR